MMRRTLNIVAVASAVALASVLAACGGGDDNGNELVVGASLPLSGASAALGPAGEKAAELATDQINQAAETAGTQQVELVTSDNGSNPEGAVKAARDLADQGASCIAGAWASLDTIEAAKAVTIPRGILVISPAAAADQITALRDQGLVSRTVPPDRAQGPALARVIAFALGGAEGRTVNIGVREDVGREIAASFTDTWQGLGGSVAEQVDYAPGQPDYSSVARRITSGNPGATLIVDSADNFRNLGRALAATGKWDPSKAFGTAGLASPVLLEDPGPKAVRGMRVIAAGTPDDAAPTQAFVQLFASSDPTDVSITGGSVQNFDAVVLCYLTSIAAGSENGKRMAAELQNVTDPAAPKYSWQQLPAAIGALRKGKRIDYVGASGKIDFDAKGDRTAGVYNLSTFKNELTPQGDVAISGPR